MYIILGQQIMRVVFVGSLHHSVGSLHHSVDLQSYVFVTQVGIHCGLGLVWFLSNFILINAY